MRHRKAGRKFGRKSPHRKALFSNLVASLVTHGRIETTTAKAKELRGIAEPTIHWAVGVSDLSAKDPEKLAPLEKARLTHAVRMARRVLKVPDALDKLFNEVGPSLKGRPGGYTRVLHTRHRKGDAAPMAFVELIPSGDAPAAAPAPEPKGQKGKAAKEKPAKAEAAEKPKKAAAKPKKEKAASK